MAATDSSTGGSNVGLIPDSDIAGSEPTISAGSDLGISGALGDIGTITTPATDASAATSNSGGLGSILSSLGSDISGVLSSPLGTLAEYGGLYGLEASQASAAQTQNNALAGQITDIGQPDVTAGQSLLSDYQAGTLTAPRQAGVDAAVQANQNTAVSQNQQIAQLLANSSGGGNVQSALVGEQGQVAAAQNLANNQVISQAFTQELTDSLALTGEGGAFVQSGIQQEIASNTALQQQLSQLMGTLASAYAKQTAGSGTGTGTGATSTTGSLSSLYNDITKLLNGNSATSNLGQLETANDAANASQIAGSLETDSQIASGVAGPDLTAIGSSVDDASGAIDFGDFSEASSGADAAAGAGSAADAAGAGAGLTGATVDTGALASSGGAVDTAGLTSSVNDAAASAGIGQDASALSTGLAGAGIAGIFGTVLGGMLQPAVHGTTTFGTPEAGQSVESIDGQTLLTGDGLGIAQGGTGDEGRQYYTAGGQYLGTTDSAELNNLGEYESDLSTDQIDKNTIEGQQAYYNQLLNSPQAKNYAGGAALYASKMSGYTPGSPTNSSQRQSESTLISQGQDIYDQLGGQSTFGVDFNTWASQLGMLTGNTENNLGG